jgi:hypothetical protein
MPAVQLALHLAAIARLDITDEGRAMSPKSLLPYSAESPIIPR